MIPSSWYPTSVRIRWEKLRRLPGALRALAREQRAPVRRRHSDEDMAAISAADKEARTRMIAQMQSASLGSGRFTALEVLDVERPHPEVLHMTLRPPQGEGSAAPGQFVTLRVMIPASEKGHPPEPILRSYSFSASPEGGQASWRLSMRLQPEGRLTPHLFEHLQPGDVIEASAPAGRFGRRVLEDDQAPVLLLGAGSGVTPLVSLLQAMARRGRRAPLRWVAFERSPERAMLADDVAAAVAQLDDGQARWWWTGSAGRPIDAPTFLQALPPVDASWRVLLCGPAGWVALAREALTLAGAADERIEEESFALRGSGRPAQDRVHSVQFRRSGRLLQVHERETLLGAALRAGLAMPSSCQMGGCGTCRVRTAEGEVDHPEPNTLTAEERDEGWVLPCIACPRSAIIIDG